MPTELEKENLKPLEKEGYSKKAIEFYNDKVNVGIIADADVALAYTGPCGDTLTLYLLISKEDVIENAQFQYIGCPALAACGSILTEIIKGKTIPDAKKITQDLVLSELGVLPDEESHCAELATTTLRRTILKYEQNKKKT